MKKTESPDKLWYTVTNAEDVSSPALLIYPDRVEQNIKRMIKIAGSADKLRPHIKTHKMSAIIRLQMKYGINKFKCATISETELAASCGAGDILLAMQPVGPNQTRFFELKQKFPNSKISCITDSEEIINQLSELAVKTGLETNLWLDINNGMNRTGVTPGKIAAGLYKIILDSPMVKAEGLHVYDGHIQDPDFRTRQKICDESFLPVEVLIDDLIKMGIPHPKIVAGGTPTFPIHALRKEVECSPGTLLLWDYKSSSSFADMDFLNAAILLSRIVSKPSKDILCIDLGHKAVASEMAQPRIKIPGFDNYSIIGHSEEHMVIRTSEADKFSTGDILYCIPMHICPTVALHDSVSVVNEHKVTGQWSVEARNRKICV